MLLRNNITNEMQKVLAVGGVRHTRKMRIRVSRQQFKINGNFRAYNLCVTRILSPPKPTFVFRTATFNITINSLHRTVVGSIYWLLR